MTLLSEHALCVPPHAAWIASACAASIAAHTLSVTDTRRLYHCQAPLGTPAHASALSRRMPGHAPACAHNAVPARSLQRAHRRPATGTPCSAGHSFPSSPPAPLRETPPTPGNSPRHAATPPASGLTGSPWPSCRSPPPSRSRGPRSSCRCCCAASGPACPPRVCLRARVLRPLLDPSIMPCPATLYGWPDLPAARLPARTLALPPPRSCHVLHLLTRRPACPPRAYLLFCSTSPAMSNILTAQQSLPLHA